MQDDLTRAQHYRDLALQMQSVARLKPDHARRNELIDLALKYEALAKRLVAKNASGDG